MASSPRSESRFERVQAILNTVQGPTVPDYQGHRAFWLDYETLMSVELYGQRMIAPPPEGEAPSGGGGSCGCCTPAAPASGTAPATPDAEPADAAGLAHQPC